MLSEGCNVIHVCFPGNFMPDKTSNFSVTENQSGSTIVDIGDSPQKASYKYFFIFHFPISQLLEIYLGLTKFQRFLQIVWK